MPRVPMTKAEHFKVGVAAAIGGIAPNILYVAMCLTGQERKDPGVNGGYVVGLFLLASLGYLVAWLWNERIPQRAFYLGVGLPAMLQIAMSNPTQQAPPNKTTELSSESVVRRVASFISTAAYAQEPTGTTTALATPPVLTPTDPGTITIEFKRVPTDAQLVFLGQGGKVLDQIRPDWAREAPAGRVVVSVPPDATELEVVSAFTRNAPDEPLRLDPTTKVFQPLKLESESDFLAGFLRALGRPAADEMKLSPVKNEQKKER